MRKLPLWFPYPTTTVCATYLAGILGALEGLIGEVEWAHCTERDCGCPSSQKYALAVSTAKDLSELVDKLAAEQPQNKEYYSMSNPFARFLHKIVDLFKSPKVEAVFDTIAHVVAVAEPIVADIALLVPNKTVQEIVAAYEKYAVPVSQTIVSDPSLTGVALLKLATEVTKKNLPNATAQHIVDTGVQIAVSALKAEGQSTAVGA